MTQPKSLILHVWYAIERNELTLWKSRFRTYIAKKGFSRCTAKFKAEHIKTGQEVNMIYVGEL